MKLSLSTVFLALVAGQDDDERGNKNSIDKGPYFCNTKANQLQKVEGGIKWRCKSRQSKNKGDSKKCKGKCPADFVSTAPRKVRCDERVGWMTKKQGIANIAAVRGSCCKVIRTATCDFATGNGDALAGTIDGAIAITEYDNCGDGMGRIVFSGKLTVPEANRELVTMGNHGFHVHAANAIENGCGADHLGGHFAFDVDVEGTLTTPTHGDPADSPPDRHQGDLGNLHVNKKFVADVFHMDMTSNMNLDSVLTAAGGYIGDGSLVIHAMPDELVPGDDGIGNAGARPACCKIVVN